MVNQRKAIDWDAVREFDVDREERQEVLRFQGAINRRTICLHREVQEELEVVRACKRRAEKRAREEGIFYWIAYREERAKTR